MENDGTEPSLENYNQEISNNTKKIVEEIKALEKELGDLRSSCLHSSYIVKNCPSGPEKSFNLRRVCEICQMEVGYPSQEEILNWASS